MEGDILEAAAPTATGDAPVEETIDDTLHRLVGNAPLPPLYRRAWVLSVFEVSESFGLTPITQSDAHGLVFLANALAPVYELLAPDRAVIKAAGGPFFPAVQWDLDRLCVQGLLDFEALSRGSTTEPLSYACSRAGQRLVHEALLGSPLVQSTYGYLQEVVAAFVDAGVSADRALVRVDATYATPAALGSVLDYGEWDSATERNYSFRTTQAFEAANRRAVPFSPRDRLHLYVQYLRRARQALAA